MLASGSSLFAALWRCSSRASSLTACGACRRRASVSGRCRCLSRPPASWPRGLRSFGWEAGDDRIAACDQDIVHVGPVPITEPVVVTWGLMAALTLASWSCHARADARRRRATRRCSSSSSDVIEDQIKARCASSRSRYVPADRHAVPLHPRGELVVADPGRRSADGASRDGRGARADRVLRDHLSSASARAGSAAISRPSPSRHSS